MPRKPIELPPAVARRFVEDMRAYFAEKNAIKRDEIAARQLHALRQHQGPRDKKLRLSDVTQKKPRRICPTRLGSAVGARRAMVGTYRALIVAIKMRKSAHK
jgi:hypothetical protein